MSKDMTASRRSFLKSGALVATPLAVVGTPAVAALAGDEGKDRLARIEDERSIEALNRAFLRRFNAGGHTGEFFADGRKPKLPHGVTALTFDAAAEPEHFTLSADGSRASAHFACTAEFVHELEGEGTFVDMARLQGNGAVHLSEARNFAASYVRKADGWAIERIELG